MKIILVFSGILTVAVLFWGFKFSRFGVETPEYRVLQKNGAFEIREYPSMIVASTPMAGPNPTEESSFMRLFRYISGGNETGQKIAMTTPVFTSQEGDTRQMSFVVPKKIADNGAPKARGEQVEIETMAAGKFAAYRFNGNWDINNLDAAGYKLIEWMSQNNLTAAEDPIIASYDPPFTPSFLKRNEILVRLQ